MRCDKFSIAPEEVRKNAFNRVRVIRDDVDAYFLNINIIFLSLNIIFPSINNIFLSINIFLGRR